MIFIRYIKASIFVITILLASIFHAQAAPDYRTIEQSGKWQLDVNDADHSAKIVSQQDGFQFVIQTNPTGNGLLFGVAIFRRNPKTLVLHIGEKALYFGDPSPDPNSLGAFTDFDGAMSNDMLVPVIHALTIAKTAYFDVDGERIPVSLIGTSAAVNALDVYSREHHLHLPAPFHDDRIQNFSPAAVSSTAPDQASSVATTQLTHQQAPEQERDESQPKKINYTNFYFLTALIIGFICVLIISINIYKNSKYTKKNHLSEMEIERRRLKDLYDRNIKVAFDTIQKHAKTLGIKRRQLISYDSYGKADYSKWQKEIDYFLDNVIWKLPELKDIDRQTSPQLDRNYRLAIIEAARTNQPGKNGNPLFTDDMNPYAYEHACAEVLRNAGWNAHATAGSGDQGADVVADRDGIRLVLQCKLYSNAVPNSAVQEAAAARLHYAAQYAAVVSNARYTPSAQQLAQTTAVTLLHQDQIGDWAASLVVPATDTHGPSRSCSTGKN